MATTKFRSFHTPGSNLDVQEKRQTARQSILQKMLQEAMAPPQARSAGRLLVAPHPLEYIGQGVQAWGTDRALRDSFDAQEGIADRKRQQVAEEIKNYFQKKKGTPGSYSGVPGDAMQPDSPQRPGVPADPQGAMAAGLSSAHPLLQQMAAADAAATPYDYMKVPGATVNSRVATQIAARQGIFNPEQHLRGDDKPMMTPGGELIRVPETGAPTSQGYFGPKLGPAEVTQSPAGPILTQTQEGSNEIKKIQGPESKGVTVNVGDKVGLHEKKTQIDRASKYLETSRKSADAAMSDLTVLRGAIESYNEGIRTGTWQGGRNTINKALETFNVKGKDDKTMNTDLYMRQMASRILAYADKLRPMSNIDIKYLELIKAGKDLDAEGTKRFLELAVDQNLKEIELHTAMVGKTPGGAEMDLVDPSQIIEGLTIGEKPPPGSAASKLPKLAPGVIRIE